MTMASGTLVTAGAVAYALVLPGFFSARAKPIEFEAAVVRCLRRLAIPGEIRRRHNPLGLSNVILREGMEHFADHCATCHGNDGRGDTEIGRNFYPPVSDLSSGDIQSLSDGEIYYVIRNGVRFTGMPAWGSDSAEDDGSNWELVHFIRHLPKITKEELRDMKTLNPKTPEEMKEENDTESFLRGGPEEAPHGRGH